MTMEDLAIELDLHIGEERIVVQAGESQRNRFSMSLNSYVPWISIFEVL